MGSEWREVELGDLFKVKHGFAFKGKFFTDEPQPNVLVTPGNFAIGGGFQDDKRKYYRGPVPNDYILQPDQIVVTMTDLSKQSDTLGFGARVPNDTNVWLHNQRVGLLVFNQSAEADVRFVEYLLRSHEYRSWVVGSATGTTVKHTSPSRIESFKTLLPPLPEQRAIAHILGTLDDKIELNRKRNETLEAMARALFKDCFVDFGPVRAKLEGRDPYLPAEIWDLFPDRLDEEGKPEGWGRGTLGDFFYLTMGQSPPGNTYNDLGIGLPFFQGRTDFGFRYPTNRKYCSAPTRIANPGDTLVSVRAPVGDINLAWEKCCIGRGVAAIRHISGLTSYTYHALWSIQDHLKQFEHTGTVFGAINKNQFEKLPIIESSRQLINAFEYLINPFDDEIRNNIDESRTLAHLRDALLPKLISGVVRVRDVDRFIDRAIR